MNSDKKLKTFKIIKIILLVIYIPLLLVYLGLFLPEYLACLNSHQDGTFAKTIWGNEIPCFGESRGLADGLFYFYSIVIAALTIVFGAAFLVINYLKNRLLKQKNI